MKIFTALLFLCLMSCSDSNLKKDLAFANSKVSELESNMKELLDEDSGKITHLVFFDVKEGMVEELSQMIKGLEKIDVLKNLEYGPFMDLDDPRGMKQFDLVMEMSFASEKDYERYQSDPVHLKLKEAVKSMLDSPPVTYDYLRN